YAASVAFTLGAEPRAAAAALAAALTGQQPGKDRWIAQVEVAGPGYLTITVTPEALAAVTVPAAPPDDPLTAPTWEAARAALAARLTARLAAAAGAMIAELGAAE